MDQEIRSADARSEGGALVERMGDYFRGSFSAMASPCEVLIDADDPEEAAASVCIAEQEARRIEAKFSRYLPDNIVHRINHSGGAPVQVDEETALLLDYAATCHEVSDGKFDITSGVLRQLWRFDGGIRVPSRAAVRDLLRLVGWHRVAWERSPGGEATLTMPPGMEIDLGGLGKEYAVDRASKLMAERTLTAFLVNFGGDLFAGGPRRGKRPWVVGIDDPERTGESAVYRVELDRGGLATTGDARRFVRWKGRRLSHILNPKTGWPVEDAPRSVTVLAPTCLEAGTLSTLAYLEGPGARAFLEGEGVEFRVL
jgi:thiamine biosynthesis lipoprotein